MEAACAAKVAPASPAAASAGCSGPSTLSIKDRYATENAHNVRLLREMLIEVNLCRADLSVLVRLAGPGQRRPPSSEDFQQRIGIGIAGPRQPISVAVAKGLTLPAHHKHRIGDVA